MPNDTFSIFRIPSGIPFSVSCCTVHVLLLLLMKAPLRHRIMITVLPRINITGRRRPFHPMSQYKSEWHLVVSNLIVHSSKKYLIIPRKSLNGPHSSNRISNIGRSCGVHVSLSLGKLNELDAMTSGFPRHENEIYCPIGYVLSRESFELFIDDIKGLKLSRRGRCYRRRAVIVDRRTNCNLIQYWCEWMCDVRVWVETQCHRLCWCANRRQDIFNIVWKRARFPIEKALWIFDFQLQFKAINFFFMVTNWLAD